MNSKKWQGLFIQSRYRLLTVNALALLGGLVMNPVMAVVTDPPILIHGRAPTAAGTVSILMPDGTTTLVDNAPVSGVNRPEEFILAPLSAGIVFSDEDGDAPGIPGLAIAPSGIVWAWKGPTGAALTEPQLNQTFMTNFAHNAVFSVQATVPISTSLTGIPTTSGTPTVFATPTYRVKVIYPPPVIHVNGVNFAWNSGFPTTGFVGAEFQLYMNGIDATVNSNYGYSVNQSWATSAPDGTISFTGTPTPASKKLRIIATNKTDSTDKHTLDIVPGRWFVKNNTLMTAAPAESYCAGLGNGYVMPPSEALTNAIYGSSLNNKGSRAATEGLWSEWGVLSSYSAQWVVSNYYWTSTNHGQYRLQVYFGSSGNLVGNLVISKAYVACLRAL